MSLTQINMDLYINITNDTRGLRQELGEKKEDLFDPKAGKPQLMVNRLSSINGAQNFDSYSISKFEIESVEQLTKISKVSCY